MSIIHLFEGHRLRSVSGAELSGGKARGNFRRLVLAALPEAIAQSKELNRQKFENPDSQMSFYLQEVFGDRDLTDAQILEEINDRVESKLTALVEDLHYTAFESDRHLEATASLEAALQRRQIGGSSTKGFGFGKK